MARHERERAGEKRAADSLWGPGTLGRTWASSFADHCGAREAGETVWAPPPA